ncbi:MAG TPA: nitroreductase family protein [Bacilli bacterium]|nr:nitroreductase family protein [Bacilli bacterium]
MNFEELVKSRHSAVNFIENEVMTEEDFKKIFELTKLAPSAVVIVMGNKNRFKKDEVEKIYQPLKLLKMINEVDYDMTLEAVRKYTEKFKENPSALDAELARNAGISAMLFMLNAKYYGFDTCPMHVHNIDQLRSEFNIPDHLEPMMMITIGKSVDKVRPRGYRHPVNDFVKFNGY